MSSEQAAGKAHLLERAMAALRAAKASDLARNVHGWFVPGRIEVMGKHTDYAGGRSLVVATEQGLCMVGSPRQDLGIRIIDARDGQEARFELVPELSPTPGHWSNYPMTVARRIARNFSGPLRGADIAFVSDLPPAAGMSSSSVLMIATFLALSHINDLAQRQEYRANIHGPESLAGYLATVENGQTFGTLIGDRGVGTFGGSQDHTAILCCRAEQLSQYSFCPVRFERTITMPRGYVFAIGVSGVVAEKTREAMEKYNRVSRQVSSMLESWRAATQRNDRCLGDALHSSPEAPDRMRAIVTDNPPAGFDAQSLLARLDQFTSESEQIIPAVGDALAAGDMPSLGALVDRSQHLAEQALHNQVPQTIDLARAARELGAVAASAFGAGFGGSVWAMVPAADADSFLRDWRERYQRAHPRFTSTCTFLLTRPAEGAFGIV
jgi:galactokinase